MKIEVIQCDVNSDQEAIKACGNHLMKLNVVDATYVSSCMKREIEFPTGLPSTIPVAIPHTFEGYVSSTTICYAQLKHSVAFRRMDNPDQALAVRHVFCMALKDESTYVHYLSAMIENFQSESFLNKLETLPFDKLQAYLIERFLIHHAKKNE